MTEKTKKPQLKAEARPKGSSQNKKIRRSGFIPGVVYGRGIPNVLVKVESAAFGKIFQESGEHTLVDLSLDKDDTRTVLIHDVDFDPVKNTPIHIDFYQVRLDETVRTEIPLTFTGTSSAVKDLEGTLVKAIHSIEIEALPTDIPREITVDITPLKTFEDQILVKDIKVDKGVNILAEPEESVASVEAPKTKEELEELEEAVVEDVEAIEGVEKGEDEEEKQDKEEGREEDKKGPRAPEEEPEKKEE